MKKRRWIAIGTALLLLALCGCGGAEQPKAETEVTSETAEEEKQPFKFPSYAGEVERSVYINERIALGCRLDSNWVISDYSDLLEKSLPDMSEFSYTFADRDSYEECVRTAMTNGGVLWVDFYAERADGSYVSVALQSFPTWKNYKTFTEDRFLEAVDEAMDEEIKEYKNLDGNDLSFSISSIEKTETELLGDMRPTLLVTGMYDNIPTCYQTTYLHKGQVVVTLSSMLSFAGKEENAAFWECFCSADEARSAIAAAEEADSGSDALAGTREGQAYENVFFSLGCTLAKEWTCADTEELNGINAEYGSALSLEELTSDTEDDSEYYVFCAATDSKLVTISVMQLDPEIFAGVTEDLIVYALIDSTKEELVGNGCSNVTVEQKKVLFMDKLRPCVSKHYEREGIWNDELFFPIIRDGWMMKVEFLSTGEDIPDNLLFCFRSLE